MTINRASASAPFHAEPAPVGGIEAVKAWAAAMFDQLFIAAQRPRVQAVFFARAELVAEVAKPIDGMTAWLAPAVAGPGLPEGLYFRMGGTWKLVTLT